MKMQSWELYILLNKAADTVLNVLHSNLKIKQIRLLSVILQKCSKLYIPSCEDLGGEGGSGDHKLKLHAFIVLWFYGNKNIGIS